MRRTHNSNRPLAQLAVQRPLQKGEGVTVGDAGVHVSPLHRLPLAPDSVDVRLSREETDKQLGGLEGGRLP